MAQDVSHAGAAGGPPARNDGPDGEGREPSCRTPTDAFGFNAATPFITPNPPWLSDVPVVFAIMMLLIIIVLLHRIQTESHDGG